MKKILVLVCFFTVTPCVLLASIILLSFHSFKANSNNHFLPLSNKLTDTTITYAALPSTEIQLSGSVGSSDTRIQRVKAFFHAYGSLLEQYSQDIVEAADKYNLDYRLLPAISMQESQGCKRIVIGTNNCFGWGINSKQTIGFDSYSQAIDTISKLIAKNYVHKGLNTPEEIGRIYNPTNTNNWTGNVNYFMNQVQLIL